MGSHFGKLRVVGFCQLLVVGQLSLFVAEPLPEVETMFQLAMLAQDGACPLRVGKQFRVGHSFVEAVRRGDPADADPLGIGQDREEWAGR
ncbi:MAG: hypothetical protein RJA16_414, partial [Planctomycetota bacterium]